MRKKDLEDVNTGGLSLQELQIHISECHNYIRELKETISEYQEEEHERFQ